MFADSGKVDHQGKFSIYGQVIDQLRRERPDMSNFRIKGLGSKCLHINFKGEGSLDYGGPFRDALTNIIQELESSVLPLLIPTANNSKEVGAHRECFMFNPDATSPAHLEMLGYLGAFIAFGILSKQPFALNLAPAVWKQILGETMLLKDLESIDFTSAKLLQDLQSFGKAKSAEEFEAAALG